MDVSRNSCSNVLDNICGIHESVCTFLAQANAAPAICTRMFAAIRTLRLQQLVKHTATASPLRSRKKAFRIHGSIRLGRYLSGTGNFHPDPPSSDARQAMMTCDSVCIHEVTVPGHDLDKAIPSA